MEAGNWVKNVVGLYLGIADPNLLDPIIQGPAFDRFLADRHNELLFVCYDLKVEFAM